MAKIISRNDRKCILSANWVLCCVIWCLSNLRKLPGAAASFVIIVAAIISLSGRADVLDVSVQSTEPPGGVAVLCLRRRTWP